MLGAASSRDNVAKTWNGGGLEKNLGPAMVLEELGIVVDGVQLARRDTSLRTITASPNQRLTLGSDGNVVVASTFNMFDIEALETLDDFGGEDTRIVLTCVRDLSSLAVVVGTPGPDMTVLSDGKTMVISTGNLDHLLAGLLDGAIMEADAVGEKSFLEVALRHTTTKLVLLAAAPSVDTVVLVKCKNMVGSARNMSDLLETLDVNRPVCCMRAAFETENTFVLLLKY